MAIDNSATSSLLRGTLHGRLRKLTTRVLLALLQPLLRLQILGADRVPAEGPLLVVSNHLSNADPPLLVIAFPRTVFFVGKSELFRVPALGWLLRRFGGFPVVRGSADRPAIRHALAVLGQGIAMGIFPEGGRSRTGALTPGYPGVGFIALQSGAPILPVAITGTEFFPVNGERPPRRRKGEKREVTIQFGEPFQIPERVDGKRVTSDEATTLMMLRIAALLPEAYQGVYGPIR